MRGIPVALLALLAVACGSSSVATPGATPAPSTATDFSASPAPSSISAPIPSPSSIPASRTREPGGATPTPADDTTPPPEPSVFQLTSPAFLQGQPIPQRYTCDGADEQLPLSWSGVPEGTVELALIQHDPDAGGWVHWVVVAIPADATSIDGPLPDGARHGVNDFRRVGYDGPCPPSGNHTYVTTLFALSAPLELGDAPTARQVRRAAEAVTIARAQLRGTYRRAR